MPRLSEVMQNRYQFWHHEALLHKSGDRRAFPFPGQTYPTA